MLHHSDKSGNMDDLLNMIITSTMLLCCAVQCLSEHLFIVYGIENFVTYETNESFKMSHVL